MTDTHIAGTKHIVWVNATSEEALLISFTELAEVLPAFVAKEEINQRKLVEAIKWWFEECQEHWLLIFDNAEILHWYGRSRSQSILVGASRFEGERC